jgi:phosphoribosyl 1,2-cyclic phosphodiesterase
MHDSGGEILDSTLQVRFWGVRGSTPTPVPANMGYGGNTPCVEVLLGTQQNLILDAGTGIRGLGVDLLNRQSLCANLNIFLTHFHWDHLQGIPFFLPMYTKGSRITFHSVRPVEEMKEFLRGQMVTPYFPVHFEQVSADLHFAQVTDIPIPFGEAQISSFSLTHPQGSNGYKVATRHGAVVYATDHEHGAAAADELLLEVARGAKVLIYDAHFTPEEYAKYAGRGHSTWLEAVKLAERARVEKLVLFHHDPAHHDEAMDRIVNAARRYFPNTEAAREGTTLRVCG